MPSETDALLPRGNTAPEISGYGFSKPSQSQYQTQNGVLDYPEDTEDKSEQQARPSYGDISPLRTLIAIFIIVVGLAMFVSLLIPGAFDPPWNKARKHGALTVKARVDKILAGTPLIGPPVFFPRRHISTSSNSRIRVRIFGVHCSSFGPDLEMVACPRSEYSRNMFHGSIHPLK